MPPQIFLNMYDEEKRSIALQTSLGSEHEIVNYQVTTILKSDENKYREHEREFKSAYQGKMNPIYNCHGLTFASRRTGIYATNEILKILRDEYIIVKSQKDLLAGDVAIYFNHEETEILHSGIVTFVDKSGSFPDIRVLSKILKGQEIVHKPFDVPLSYRGVLKFFRIEHKIEIRICS